MWNRSLLTYLKFKVVTTLQRHYCIKKSMLNLNYVELPLPTKSTKFPNWSNLFIHVNVFSPPRNHIKIFDLYLICFTRYIYNCCYSWNTGTGGKHFNGKQDQQIILHVNKKAKCHYLGQFITKLIHFFLLISKNISPI